LGVVKSRILFKFGQWIHILIKHWFPKFYCILPSSFWDIANWKTFFFYFAVEHFIAVFFYFAFLSLFFRIFKIFLEIEIQISYPVFYKLSFGYIYFKKKLILSIVI
jgi:hypothetical protein